MPHPLRMKKRKKNSPIQRQKSQVNVSSPILPDYIPTDWQGSSRSASPAELSYADIRERFKPAKSLGGNEEVRAAMDAQLEADGCYSLLEHSFRMGVFPGGASSFMGYGALQNIAQNGLVRACIDTVADDMTRNWIEFTATDNERDTDDERLLAIEEEFERLHIRETIAKAATKTGFYGGCLLYIETDAINPRLADPLVPGRGSAEAGHTGWLKGVRLIDPVNIFPGTYDTSHPLAPTYYRPTFWWILSEKVHSSRLIRIVENEPPLLMLPAYNFFGIPRAQILWDYIAHFQKNRDVANRLFDKFSLLVFKSGYVGDIFDASSLEQFDRRMMMLAKYRNNESVIAIDNDTEDIVKVETPLSGITDLPRQSLEFVAALNRTPVVKLLGVSPNGFNATGESDIRNYYDHIKSQQEKVLRPAIQAILDCVQLSLFGDIDRSIKFEFCALSEEDENKVATTQQIKIGNICQLLDRDVISPEEARQYLINDPDSGLNDLDPDAVPEPDDMEQMQAMQGMMGMGESAPAE